MKCYLYTIPGDHIVFFFKNSVYFCFRQQSVYSNDSYCVNKVNCSPRHPLRNLNVIETLALPQSHLLLLFSHSRSNPCSSNTNSIIFGSNIRGNELFFFLILLCVSTLELDNLSFPLRFIWGKDKKCHLHLYCKTWQAAGK